MRTLALALLVGCSGSHDGVSTDAPSAESCTWSPAIELAEFGDAAVERDPTEPADLLELYYTSDASPGDILFATRASTDAPFVTQPLPSFVTEGAIDMSPALSADGLRLMFVNDRGASAMVYETSRATRTSPWSTPQPVLSQWPVDVGAGITMSADGLKVFAQLNPDGVLFNFVRTATDRPFAPDNNLISVMPSPAVDDANTAIYYNCGASVCMRPMQNTGPYDSSVGDEQPVAMGTASGAHDPWVEAGGNTVVFAAEHSLYRAMKSCTP
jgi:WD40-like Beta Propeller Repeat